MLPWSAAPSSMAMRSRPTTSIDSLATQRQKRFPFYGKIDVGYTHDTHGAPPTDGGTLGSNYVIAKNSNKGT